MRAIGAGGSCRARRSGRSRRPLGTVLAAAVLHVDLAVGVGVLQEAANGVGVEVPAGNAVHPIEAVDSRWTLWADRAALASRSHGAGVADRTGRAGLARGAGRPPLTVDTGQSGRAGRTLRTRGSGRADLAPHALQSVLAGLALGPRGTCRAGWPLRTRRALRPAQRARRHVGAHRRHLLAHLP